MVEYQKYINALRKCAKEHDNDRTSTGHIIVSDLCRDTANLLEELEQQPKYCDRNICLKNEYNGIGCNECEVTKSQEPCEDCISRAEALKCITWMNTKEDIYYNIQALPSVQPKAKMESEE